MLNNEVVSSDVESYSYTHSVSPLPSMEESTSIGALANIDEIVPKQHVSFLDSVVQTLAAASRCVVYNTVAAELWSKNMDFNSHAWYEPHRAVHVRQVNGILRFAEDIDVDGDGPVAAPMFTTAQSQRDNTAEWTLPTPPPPSLFKSSGSATSRWRKRLMAAA
ncbi:uncharacterized protein ColSpa_10133 [Colletotrichum spaethianum]|uniref:Uncharacterized protein n=1 Tax=Colletotrichum spaethianum TaxID=700344 RepID=A0AA37UR25_9PEZI|nr:uncharacterized protein ColSpa_10133 [Colletotrichum spaethianum]GKT49952.1 hypothetical protein ColSpa_10133 [Colletotrichum spaethianum]